MKIHFHRIINDLKLAPKVMVRQLLLALKESEVKHEAQEEKIRKLTISVVETRARVRFLEEQGDDDVYL